MNQPNKFKDRCKDDPQGVIKELLEQSSRQAATIHKRGLRIEELDKELTVFLSVLKKVAPEEVLLKFHEALEKRKKK